MAGMVIATSLTVRINESSSPPKYPAIRPSISPAPVPRNPAINATLRVWPIPRTHHVHKSLPCTSVPKKCSALGGCRGVAAPRRALS